MQCGAEQQSALKWTMGCGAVRCFSYSTRALSCVRAATHTGKSGTCLCQRRCEARVVRFKRGSERKSQVFWEKKENIGPDTSQGELHAGVRDRPDDSESHASVERFPALVAEDLAHA
eukprot:6193922-Pleurochrysis_carterae.AAC.6